MGKHFGPKSPFCPPNNLSIRFLAKEIHRQPAQENNILYFSFLLVSSRIGFSHSCQRQKGHRGAKSYGARGKRGKARHAPLTTMGFPFQFMIRNTIIEHHQQSMLTRVKFNKAWKTSKGCMPTPPQHAKKEFHEYHQQQTTMTLKSSQSLPKAHSGRTSYNHMTTKNPHLRVNPAWKYDKDTLTTFYFKD